MFRVSVALPVYNGERYLRNAIESILAQTYEDFEFIICDNASTDSTEQICREYGERDKRIRYFRNDTNIGAPRNFNRAFELTHGEYLKWATCDDYVAPEMIERCLEVLETHPDVVLCYPNAKLVDSEGNLIKHYEDVLHLPDPSPRERFIQLLTRIQLAHQHLGLIRSSALKKTSLHGSFIAADINFLAELSLYGKFYQLSDYLLYRRFHPGSSSWDRASRSRQVEWSDPGRGNRVRMDTWEASWSFFRSVHRSRSSLRDKWAMYLFLLHRTYWSKGTLAREFADACGRFWRRSASASFGAKKVTAGTGDVKLAKSHFWSKAIFRARK